MPTKKDITPDRWRELLVAHANGYGSLTLSGAVHLLTWTELPDRTRFPEVVDVLVEGGNPTGARVRDWAVLADHPVADRIGGSNARMLALAISMAAGRPTDLRDGLSGFGMGGMRRVVEAVLIATGGNEFYELADLPALTEYREAQRRLLAGGAP